MELQNVLNVIGGLLIAIIGWMARQVWEAVQRLKDDMSKLEASLPINYVRKSDFDTTMHRIEDMFQRIYDKLDGKVDKA